MLKQMRSGAKSIVLKVFLFGLLILAMAGLALMDVQGMFRKGTSPTTIAEYANQKLSVQEFDHLVQKSLRNQHIQQEDAYRSGLPQKILKQEINNRLFTLAANDIGLQINDDLALKEIRRIIEPLISEGMSEKDAFNRLLRVYNLTEDSLVALIKSQLSSQQLLETISTGIHAPKQLVQDALRHSYEWRQGEYFKLTSANIPKAKAPSEEELQAYYNSIAHEYTLPEYRTLETLLLDHTLLADSISISDDVAKAYYDENIIDYKMPETRFISQAVSADKLTAEKIYTAAKKTGNLEQSAKDEKGSFIKATMFTESEIPVEFTKTAFTAKLGDFLEPTKTPLGWHVLHIEKISDPMTKTFASVQAEIKKELIKERAEEALYKQINKIDDEIAGGKTLSEVAEENNIKPVVISQVTRDGLDITGNKIETDIPSFSRLLEEAFLLEEGMTSQMIEDKGGAFLLVTPKEITPSVEQPLEKVRAEIVSRWTTNENLQALSKISTKLMKRIKDGESFSSIAKEFKQKVRQTKLIKRGTKPEKAKLDYNALEALFSLNKTGDVTTIAGNKILTLIRLADRKIKLPEKTAEKEAQKIKHMLNKALKNDLLEQFRQSLITKYDVSINEKLMSDLYSPDNDMNGEE